MKHILTIAAMVILVGGTVSAQTSTSNFNFIEYQKSFPRMNEAFRRKEDTLMKQFQEKGLPWPAKYIYVRSFKYDSQMEVWVKYERNEKFRLFKTYKVCALAGTLGPKRMQGDYQVPEGFYYINEFKPNSNYHMALGLNYPNASDKILSDSTMPGGDIYIHGSCVTTGCIPVTDQQIEEIYILAAHAKSLGQDFIPVHIFPIRFTNPKSIAYLEKYTRDFPEYAPMADELKSVYTYFEKTKELPVIITSRKGDYIVDAPPIPVKEEKEILVKRKSSRPVKTFDENEIAKVVDKLPVYPGGNEGFQLFIDNVCKKSADYLDINQKKAYVMVEFVIDKEGKTAYAKVIKGGNDDLNDYLVDEFEKMPTWTPATRLEKNVAVKLKQSLYIEKPESVAFNK
jgi:murein L,D-transpeptidase YafK